MTVLTRQNFKEYIPATILERGLKYFRDGSVVDLYHPDEHTWTAQVEGTEMYDVEIVDTGEGSALECSCTCPYEHGEHCKHVVAVLFAIEAETQAETPARGKKPKKAPTPQDQLRTLLKDASRGQLLDIVLEKAKTDKPFALNLMIVFGQENASATDHARIIADILKTGRDKHGYIDYRGAITASRQLEKLAKRADTLAQQGNIAQAIAIYQALIQETGEAGAGADDSSGSLGAIVASALEALEEMAADMTPDQRTALHDFLIKASQISWLRWSDMSWDALYVAGAFVDTDERQAAYFQALDAISRAEKDEQFFRDYTRREVERLKLAVITRRQGKPAADAYIEANLENDEFRQAAIARRIAEGKLEEAQWLAEEALAKYEKTNDAGLISDYQAILLDIAQRRGDIRSVKMFARRRFLESGDWESLAALKAAVPTEAWFHERDSLVRAMERSKAFWLISFLASEGLWEEVMLHGQSRGLGAVARYLDELDKRFPDRMAELYEKSVLSIMKYASSRPEYEDASRVLKRIKLLPGPGYGARVAELVARFRAQFPKRRALLEELSRV